MARGGTDFGMLSGCLTQVEMMGRSCIARKRVYDAMHHKYTTNVLTKIFNYSRLCPGIKITSLKARHGL
ncbi:hypothetical protein TSAR_007308 [Trichomalopsis sarcophagae]|uniref:Uncharacterized protein n=1 Tax=Trichomalopsis sarcophagae TaxID=543379 RepID=A0A232FIT1_9HYME|nr:hypothetical protein TSAR_007308 [Trichomalopsis sarcophagae]